MSRWFSFVDFVDASAVRRNERSYLIDGMVVEVEDRQAAHSDMRQ
jgi:hypothetical protein